MAVAAAAAIGCGSSSDDDTTSTAASTAAAAATSTAAATTPATTEAAGEAPKIAYITGLAMSSFQEAQQKGLLAGVGTGGSSKVFVAPFDPNKFLSACKDAISSGRFNSMVLQALDPPTGVPCANLAKAAGMPVAAMGTTIGTDPDSIESQVPGVVYSTPSSPKAQAESNIEMIGKACEGLDPCNVIFEIASPTDPLTNESIKAVQQAVPNVKVVGKLATGFDPTVITQKLPDLLTANPNTNVIVTIADSSALAVIPTLKAAKVDGVKVIGQGGSAEGVQAIKDGTMFSTTGNWPQQEGTLIAKALQEALNGGTPDPSGIEEGKIDTPEIIYADNVDEFTPEWGAGT